MARQSERERVREEVGGAPEERGREEVAREERGERRTGAEVAESENGEREREREGERSAVGGGGGREWKEG